MTDKNVKYLTYAALALVAVALVLVAVLVAAPTTQTNTRPQAMVTVSSGTHFGTVNADTGYITTLTADSFTLGSDTFTGTLKYGTKSSYTHDAQILHGFATTPTMCMLWPAPITATLTITSTGFSSDVATNANPVYWICGK